MRILFKLRTLIATIPLLLSFFYPSLKQVPGPWPLVPGSIFFSLGLSLRIWSQQYLGYRIPRKYRCAQGKKLTTRGPYQACRNPVYIGNIIIIAGLQFFTGSPQLVPLSVAWSFFTYHLVVTKYEEPHLMEKYGIEYVEYLSKVNRWLPSPQNLEGAFKDSGPFPLKLAFRFEAHNLVWTFPFLLRYFFF